MDPDNDRNGLAARLQAIQAHLAALRHDSEASPRLREGLTASLEELQTALKELEAAQEELSRQAQELAAVPQALEAERQRYRDLFEWAPDSYLVTGAEEIIQEANRAAATLLRGSPDVLVGQPLIRFIAEEERQAFRSQLIQQGWEGNWQEQEWEVRLQTCTGMLLEGALRVTPVRDPNGQLVALRWLIRDITERKQAERDRQRLLREQACQRELLETLIERLPFGIAVVTGPEHRCLLANPAYRKIPALAVEGYRELLEEVYRTGEAVRVREYEIALPGQAPSYWNLENVPLRDPEGRLEAVLLLAQEVTQEVEARRRLQVLSEAGTLLSASLDYETTLQSVACLAIPVLAEGCSVDLLEEGELRQVAVAHRDPAREPLIRELRRLYPFDPHRPYGTSRVIATGQSELVPEVSPAWLESITPDAERLGLLRALGVSSFMIVPLKVREELLGAISLFSSAPGRRYGPDDLSQAEELADRAALAIDTARLHRELREANRRKDEFLAVLAHELRNPLGALLNAIQVLRLRSLGDPLQGPAQDAAERQVRQMKRLLDDLTDISRIGRGQIRLNRELVNLAAVVEDAVQTVCPLIRSQGHELSLALPPEPLWLEADPARLTQVLSNLLGNAAKYTPPGGRIGIAAECEGDWVVVRVWDNGVGIAPEFLPRIFDLFAQAERTRHSPEGLGIGLALVKHLVELHGGTVEAYSAGPGEGSEFVVRLPLRAESPASLSPATPSEEA